MSSDNDYLSGGHLQANLPRFYFMCVQCADFKHVSDFPTDSMPYREVLMKGDEAYNPHVVGVCHLCVLKTKHKKAQSKNSLADKFFRGFNAVINFANRRK